LILEAGTVEPTAEVQLRGWLLLALFVSVVSTVLAAAEFAANGENVAIRTVDHSRWRSAVGKLYPSRLV
jgi:hypothetical protein